MNFKIKDKRRKNEIIGGTTETSEWMKFKIAIWCNTFNWHDDKLIRSRDNKDTYQCKRCDRYRDVLKPM